MADWKRPGRAFQLAATIVACLAIVVTACAPAGSTGSTGASSLSGAVKVDGSSTVFPVTEAVGEEFQKLHQQVQVTVGISGTGGGFQKFCAGETDISNASRPIRAAEAERCAQANIEYVEIPVAYDGLSVMVNPANTWAQSMTVAELKKLWEPEAQGKITRWNQIRPEWPDQPINLYGAGTDSGTFDYFTEAIVGKEDASRGDFTASEDDNVLVQGISGDVNALGYFGYAYYVENKDKLKLVGIDGGNGPVLPSEQTINDGTYAPLSRPIFIYVKKASADRPEVKEFVEFYLEKGPELVKQVGYIPLPSSIYQTATQRFDNRVVGSVFLAPGAQTRGKLEEVYKAQ